jgi:hypothetical protein
MMRQTAQADKTGWSEDKKKHHAGLKVKLVVCE